MNAACNAAASTNPSPSGGGALFRLSRSKTRLQGWSRKALASFDHAERQGYDLFNLPFQRGLSLLAIGDLERDVALGKLFSVFEGSNLELDELGMRHDDQFIHNFCS